MADYDDRHRSRSRSRDRDRDRDGRRDDVGHQRMLRVRQLMRLLRRGRQRQRRRLATSPI